MEAERIELNERARKEGTDYPKKRMPYFEVERFLEDRIAIALVGPRGTGKTIILKQLLAKHKNSFFIALDADPVVPDLFETAKELSEKGIKLLFLDEVHTQPRFDRVLKKISDFLPIKTVFTSSSSISLAQFTADLSRRVRTVFCNPFSFWEYLLFNKNMEFPRLSFSELLELPSSRKFYPNVMKAERFFKSYLQGGSYPFASGIDDPLPLFRNILETIIARDLVLTGRATPEEAGEIRRMMQFIGSSPAEGISYSSISQNTGITKYRSEKYSVLLEQAFVLMRVLPKGTNITKEPKILIAPPYRLLFNPIEASIGSLREDFFVQSMQSLGYETRYLKSLRGEKIPDYLVQGAVFEIGGISKSVLQFKGFSAKKRLILTDPGSMDESRRPLFFAGMLTEQEAKPSAFRKTI